MANRNPGRIVDCPRCPKRLRYVTTREAIASQPGKDGTKSVSDVHVYECASHGRFHLGPSGRLVTPT